MGKILIRGFLVGVASNLFQILGEVSFFSDAPVALPISFVFKTLGTVTIIVGVVWILLSMVKVEQIVKEE